MKIRNNRVSQQQEKKNGQDEFYLQVLDLKKARNATMPEAIAVCVLKAGNSYQAFNYKIIGPSAVRMGSIELKDFEAAKRYVDDITHAEPAYCDEDTGFNGKFANALEQILRNHIQRD